MSLNQSVLLELSEVLRVAGGGEVTHLLLAAVLQALVDAEATATVPAFDVSPQLTLDVSPQTIRSSND